MKRRAKRKSEVPLITGFPQVLVTSDTDNMAEFNVSETDTKRKQYSSGETDSEGEHYPDPEQEGLLLYEQTHGQARCHHLQMQQPPSYVAVLNDPAMKQKLKERNTKLEQI